MLTQAAPILTPGQPCIAGGQHGTIVQVDGADVHVRHDAEPWQVRPTCYHRSGVLPLMGGGAVDTDTERDWRPVMIAAPALYEALKLFLAWDEIATEEDTRLRELYQAIKAGRAAIAQAEGR